MHRRSRVALVTSLLAVMVAMAVPTAAGSTGTEPLLPAVDGSKLRVVIETSSDWTKVRIHPGSIVSQSTVETYGDTTLKQVPAGWKLSGPAYYQRAVIDVVVAEVTGAPTFTITTEKGWVGATRVMVFDLDEGGETRAYIVNQQQSSTDPTNKHVFTLQRETLLGTQPLELELADDDARVLAFYYPWFSTYDDARLADRPLDPRSTYRYRDVLSMTRQAHRHGIDGFIVSWRGEHDGYGFDLARRAAEQTGSTVTGYLETKATASGEVPTADDVHVALVELLTRADSPAFLKSDGIPVVFAYQMGALAPSGWRQVLDRLEGAGTPVRVVGDADSSWFEDIAWGVHQYGPGGTVENRAQYGRRQAIAARADAALGLRPAPRLWAATVAPGYDDSLIRDGNPVIERNGGARYDATWDAAVATRPDWILVTSWNEWFEKTSVEPSVEYGDQALGQTRDRAAAWRD